jgi:hypothetical protein
MDRPLTLYKHVPNSLYSARVWLSAIVLPLVPPQHVAVLVRAAAQSASATEVGQTTWVSQWRYRGSRPRTTAAYAS